MLKCCVQMTHDGSFYGMRPPRGLVFMSDAVIEAHRIIAMN